MHTGSCICMPTWAKLGAPIVGASERSGFRNSTTRARAQVTEGYRHGRMQLERPSILVYSASSRSGRAGKPFRACSNRVAAKLHKALILLRKPQ